MNIPNQAETMLEPVPDGDILIHSGDFTNYGRKEEVVKFNNWLGTLPHRWSRLSPFHTSQMMEMVNLRYHTGMVYLPSLSSVWYGIWTYTRTDPTWLSPPGTRSSLQGTMRSPLTESRLTIRTQRQKSLGVITTLLIQRLAVYEIFHNMRIDCFKVSEFPNFASLLTNCTYLENTSVEVNWSLIVWKYFLS